MTVVRRDADHLDVFAQGSDTAMWASSWNGEPFRDRGRLGPWAREGIFGPGVSIAALSRNPDQMDLFAIAAPGWVRTAWWNGDPWHEWRIVGDTEDHGRGVAPRFDQRSTLAAVARTSDHMNLLGVGPDGHIHQAWWNGGPWAWEQIAGGPGFAQGTPVDAVSRSSDYIDAFAVGSDGRLHHAWWNGNPWRWEVICPDAPPLPERTPVTAIARTSDGTAPSSVDSRGVNFRPRLRLVCGAVRTLSG